MSRKTATRLPVIPAALTLLVGAAFFACDRPSTPGVTAAQPRLPDPQVKPDKTPSEKPPEAPSDRGAAEPPTPATPADVPKEPVKKIPTYLTIVEPIDRNRRATLTARTRAPATLEIDTHNVQRLRITRAGLPLTRRRSTVVRIDGQGIEWTPNHAVVVLERSRHGVWSVVRRRGTSP